MAQIRAKLAVNLGQIRARLAVNLAQIRARLAVNLGGLAVIFLKTVPTWRLTWRLFPKSRSHFSGQSEKPVPWPTMYYVIKTRLAVNLVPGLGKSGSTWRLTWRLFS